MKTKNAMLTTGAAPLIAGAAVIGGYYVDSHSTLITTTMASCSTPRPAEGRAVSAMDKTQVGDTVTIYGKLRANEDKPKVYAEAICDPATKTLYHINGDRPAKELINAEITSRYTLVKSVQSAKITTTKVMTARD